MGEVVHDFLFHRDSHTKHQGRDLHLQNYLTLSPNYLALSCIMIYIIVSYIYYCWDSHTKHQGRDLHLQNYLAASTSKEIQTFLSTVNRVK